MHAYANPDREWRGSSAGMTIARFNKSDRTITSECWPRFQDLSKKDAEQFPGWPRVIPQLNNYNPPSWKKLAPLSFNVENPVVQLIDEESGDVLYTLRINGRSFTPHAPEGKTFTIKVGVDGADKLGPFDMG